MPKPKIEEFMNDPKYAEDRGFFEQCFDAILAKKKAAADEAARNNPPEEENVFDNLFNFGAKKK